MTDHDRRLHATTYHYKQKETNCRSVAANFRYIGRHKTVIQYGLMLRVSKTRILEHKTTSFALCTNTIPKYCPPQKCKQVMSYIAAVF